MAQVTSAQQGALSSFLWQTGDSVTYLHMNVPHLPGYLALKHFGQSDAVNDHVQYAANLRFTDELLG